ncbi:Protein of unknown function [Pyronema omphalodes CBS 100304]|uniref:Uncharacterized protein n=1 Tax=Pyronema omphalodes (strain CBS 100304) TaxID=1076935 RepID=U4LC89_PYROM|nr:Protein of unknown function [Pyronema omphalodes CBS 100304]
MSHMTHRSFFMTALSTVLFINSTHELQFRLVLTRILRTELHCVIRSQIEDTRTSNPVATRYILDKFQPSAKSYSGSAWPF